MFNIITKIPQLQDVVKIENSRNYEHNMELNSFMAEAVII